MMSLVFDGMYATAFTHNRDQLLSQAIVDELFGLVRQQAAAKRLLSRDYFTIEDTLLEASASLKQFVPRESVDKEEPPDRGSSGGRNAEVNFHGEKGRNETHISKTDPDSTLSRKGPGKEASLYYCGHLMNKHHHGLIVDGEWTPATGRAEREAGEATLSGCPGNIVRLCNIKAFWEPGTT